MGDAGLARDYYSRLPQTAKNGTRQSVLDEARRKFDAAPARNAMLGNVVVAAVSMLASVSALGPCSNQSGG